MKNKQFYEYLTNLSYEKQKQIVLEDLYELESQTIIKMSDYFYFNIHSDSTN